MRHVLQLSIIFLLVGCGSVLDFFKPRPSPPDKQEQPKSQDHKVEADAPKTVEDANRRIEKLDGERAELVTERDHLRQEAREKPLRWLIMIAGGIGLLAMLGGCGLAVATQIWGLGFGMKACLGVAGLGATVLGMCFATSWAMDHMTYVLITLGVLIAGTIAWLAKDWTTRTQAAREAWNHVPETATGVREHLAQFLDKIDRNPIK